MQREPKTPAGPDRLTDPSAIAADPCAEHFDESGKVPLLWDIDCSNITDEKADLASAFDCDDILG